MRNSIIRGGKVKVPILILWIKEKNHANKSPGKNEIAYKR